MSPGYSGTPLPKKLGIVEGATLTLLGAPPGFARTLGQLPADVVVKKDLRGRGRSDVIVLFVERRTDLVRRFAAAAKRLTPAGGLWIAWPKKSSGVATDLSDGVVRELGLAGGLVDNKVCALDDTWSGLRFVVRLRDR